MVRFIKLIVPFSVMVLGVHFCVSVFAEEVKTRALPNQNITVSGPGYSAQAAQAKQEAAAVLVALKNAAPSTSNIIPSNIDPAGLLPYLNDFTYNLTRPLEAYPFIISKQDNTITLQRFGITTCINVNNLSITVTYPNKKWAFSPADNYLNNWLNAVYDMKNNADFAKIIDSNSTEQRTFDLISKGLNSLITKASNPSIPDFQYRYIVTTTGDPVTVKKNGNQITVGTSNMFGYGELVLNLDTLEIRESSPYGYYYNPYPKGSPAWTKALQAMIGHVQRAATKGKNLNQDQVINLGKIENQLVKIKYQVIPIIQVFQYDIPTPSGPYRYVVSKTFNWITVSKQTTGQSRSTIYLFNMETNEIVVQSYGSLYADVLNPATNLAVWKTTMSIMIGQLTEAYSNSIDPTQKDKITQLLNFLRAKLAQ